MSDLDLTDAVEAAARVLYAYDRVPDDEAWPEWDSLVSGSTGQRWQAIGYRDNARRVFAAAAPLIEAQVRERVAQEILDANRAYECDHSVEHGRDNYPTACVWEIAEAAAAIARGSAS